MKNNTGEKLESPKDMFLYKQQQIKKFVDEKDINIRISWAINNAVQMLTEKEKDEELIYLTKKWTNWFLSYFKEKKQEVMDEELKKAEMKSEQEDEAEMNIGLQLEKEDEDERSSKLEKANKSLGLK